MNTAKDNVQKMIAAFITFDKDQNKDAQKADDLTRFLLDHSKLPEYQWLKTGRKNKHGEEISERLDKDNLSKEQDNELAQMESLLNASRADNVIWETPEDLYNLIVTYPPVILEQLLIVAIVIRILRHDEVDMDSDTAAFEEFFQGWQGVVISS